MKCRGVKRSRTDCTSSVVFSYERIANMHTVRVATGELYRWSLIHFPESGLRERCKKIVKTKGLDTDCYSTETRSNPPNFFVLKRIAYSLVCNW